MPTHTSKPWYLRTLPDLVAFGLGLGMAYCLDWHTADLVWSLWLGSLTLGYLTILSAAAGAAYLGLQAIRCMQGQTKQRILALLAGTAAGLFFLGFFSLHFCGFHAGHSVFLESFFPIEDMPNRGFGDAFMNPPLLWLMVFRHLIKPYGLFLIPAIIAERHHVFQPLLSAVHAARNKGAENTPATDDETGKRHKSPFSPRDVMGRPYANVVRMHLLIFFFAFGHALKLDSFLVYAVVYSVYFFPWYEVKKRKQKTTDQPEQS